MSEIKRVALTTLEPQKVSDKVNKKQCKAVRISVILPESNEDKCPEYNYKDQLAAVKRRQKLGKEGKEVKEPNHVENGVDPFAEDDDDVRRIALEMEAKYGTSMTTKKKRKGRKDDYADIGMGYDENDSFIDNTDGYDEIIPQNVTTLHGGFYINCGALEFKTDDDASSQVSSSSSESEDEEEQKTSNKKKRVLDTSDEEESDTDKNPQAEKKPKLSVKNSMQQAIKKKLFSQNKIQVKKIRPIDPLKKTVKELLREKREDLNMSIPEDLLNNEDNVEKDSLKENKKPMSITSVTDAIESVVKQVVDDSYGNNQNRQSLDGNKSIEATPVNKSSLDISPTFEGDSSQDANQTEKRELVKLPENIPPDILQLVDKLKQAALDYKGEGKKKFFTDEVNSNLLSLERKCKVLGKSSRVRVYEHLAFYIKVRRETLVRRAKNLALEDEEKRMKKLINKLQMAIGELKPAVMERYEQECHKIFQKKYSREGDNKDIKMPRKLFTWTEETKKLLKDIMMSKKKCFLLEGKKDNLEELMVNFLKNSLLPLWPEGWMYLNNLKKVFNSMTESSTSKSLPESKKNNHDSFKDNTIPASKHSNLTITPVGVKTNSTKEDISNQITLTKVTTNNDNTFGSSSGEIGNGCSKPMEMTMPNTDILKKMFDEIERNAKEAVENKNSTPTNIIKDPEKSKHENNQKLMNSELVISKKESESKNPKTLSVLKESEKPPKKYESKKSSNAETVKTKQPEVFKPYADKIESSKPPTWSKDLFIAHSEQQALPTDYSKHRHGEDYSKHRLEEKKTNVEHSKHSWHVDNVQNKHQELNLPDNTMKQNRFMDGTSSKHARHNDITSKHSMPKALSDTYMRISDVANSTTLESLKQIGEIMKINDKLMQELPKMTTERNHSDGVKHKSSSVDSGVIVVNTHQKDEMRSLPKDERSDLNAVIPKSSHCQQLFDYSSDIRSKTKIEDPRPYKYAKDVNRDIKSPDLFTDKSMPNSSSFYPEHKKQHATAAHKYQEFNSNSNFLASSTPKASKSDGDDIQKVMENLRALQKLSCSPVKNDSSTSSPVSVIAYSKNFSSKSSSGGGGGHGHGGAQRNNDSNSKTDFVNSFQDDYQKQFINSLSQMAPNSSSNKSNYRCS